MGIANLFMRYPVKVLVAEKRGNSYRWLFDSAARIHKKDGSEYYHIKKLNKKIKPPPYDTIHITNKGMPILLLYSPQEGQFMPLNLKNPEGLEIEDKEIGQWHILQTRQTQEIYGKSSFWEKWGGVVMLGIIGGILFLTVIFISESLQSIASAGVQISENIARAAELVGTKPGF